MRYVSISLARNPPYERTGGTAGSARPVVVFVSPVADRKGGAETVLLDMLRNPAIRPVLAVPEDGQLAAMAAAMGITVERYDLGAVAAVRRPLRTADALRAARDAVRAARRIASIARATDAAIVHTNGLKVHMIGCVARLMRGTPLVVHQHDVPYTAAERAIWRLFLHAARRTIAANDICLPPHGPRAARRAGVVLQGLPGAPAEAPRSLPARPVLGFIGRVHPFKGVHLLLDWFEAAAARHPHITLLLHGNFSDEGAAYWAGMQPRFDRLVAAGRCRIECWGPLGKDPFEGIDILTAPSAVPEAGPRVIMEAMLRGIPAIGALSGGALRMIPSPEHGGKAADREGFLGELDRLLDPASYAAVSAAALAHARTAFGIERFWHDIDAEYAAMLGKPRTAAA
jgi:glycosyltransferase involved in cell wall biosynthesis